MNSDPGQNTQTQSLLTTASATADPSGAGSTISNTHLSTDSRATPHSASTQDPAPSDSTITANPPPEQSGNPEGTTVEIGPNAVATGHKGGEHETEVAEQQQHPESIKQEAEASLPLVNQQIELLEHTPDSVVDSGQDWVPDELKRVKVYELIGARWMDQGTAFCFGQFQEETSEALLIARSERSYNNIILSTVIRGSDVYQRQQDTLIVWTEPDGVDYALSFQDPEGCTEVWDFIGDVQRHMNGGDDPPSVTASPPTGPEQTSVTTAGIIRSGHLPRPELGIIPEIERAIKALARTQNVKERICEYIQQEDYIKSLIEVMNTAEDLESLENLHALCSMMQTILMLNDHTMYEHILEDDLFFGVVGLLEYDPDFPAHKANYREFLHQTSHFHQPIPIRDPSIQRKIHHTYRLQFLKDVVLARALDDSTFNVLNSCIIFNQIDIISHVQNDQSFLREIVKLFVDESVLNGSSATLPGNANGGPGKKAPTLVQPQSLVIGLHDNGDAASADKISDPNAMDVDQKQPSTSPKLTNGTTSSQVNGRTVVTPVPTPRSDHYAFAPPDNLSEEELAQRREVIVLVQQLCIMGKNVQLAARMALFRTLVDRGVLFGVQWAVSLPESEAVSKPMISAGGEILVALLDHDLNGVRGHVLKQVVAIEKERQSGQKGADKAETILEMACRIMARSRELAVQSQVGDALKVWMDVPPGEAAGGATAAAGTEASAALGGINKAPPRKDDPGTERYMDYFYKDCASILFKPFHDISEWRNVKEPVLSLTREETNRYVYLCDLLYNFVSQHHFRIHFYMMSSNILVRVASLLKARDKHLRHAAFRIFRLLLRQNNPNIHAQVMKHDILKPILDLTIQESRRDNLLSCSCQEYFDTMRRENMKELAKFCMSKHETEIRRLAQSPLGGQRFEQFIAWWQWEMIQQNKEPMPENLKSDNSRPLEARGWPQGRSLDAEEEDYFNADDDEEEDPIPVVGQSWPRIATVGTPSVPNNVLKRKRRLAVGSGPKGYRPPLRTPALGSLVDYGEDDEEDGPPPPLTKKSNSPQAQQRTSLSPSPELPPASPKLSHRHVSVPPPGPPPKRASSDDDDDNLLEVLAKSRPRPQSPAPGMMASMESLRSSEKRRRGDDEDDDELMDRVSKAKKPDFGMQKERFGFGNISRTKNGDDPPKKIKVRLGAASLAVASTPSTPVPSETGAKDGDTG